MCGIFGLVDRDGSIEQSVINSALAMLQHRGPDASGSWVATDGSAALGHTRLSIIDLTTGDQPIANEDRTVQIVANGEFYDYRRIRKELTERGHRLRTQSDSEIALHLYEDFGVHCLKYLRGEFALIIWDSRTRRLFAVRDRFGIKPLYYAQIGSRLYLASEAKALFAAGVPAQWDKESFYHLWFKQLDVGRTLFRNVYQVPPGHFVLATPYATQVRCYWDWNIYPDGNDLGEPTQADFDRTVEEVTHALDESVRLRLQADVPVAVYLSGGLDSAAVLGLAAKHCTSELDTFTVGFADATVDEAPIAARTADHVGVKKHVLQVTMEDLCMNFADAVFHSEMLHFNSHGTAKFLLSGLVREHGTKVVLTGEGSDEVFLGYAHFVRDLLNSRNDVQVLDAYFGAADNAEWKSICETEGAVALAKVNHSRLGFIPGHLLVFGTLALRGRPVLSHALCREFADYDPYADSLDQMDLAQLQDRSPMRIGGYLFARTNLPNYILNLLGDRMEMAHSVEGRTPFLDHHLVELLNKKTAGTFFRDLKEKVVLREATKNVIPEEIYNRRKFPFMGPRYLARDLMTEYLCEMVLSKTMRDIPMVDYGAVERFVNETVRQGGDPIDSMVLYQLASACVLQERFSLT